MRSLKLALVGAVAFGGLAHAAAPGAKPKVDATYIPYEKLGTLAKISTGETIHIKCMGAGSPTVILTAGAGDWSAAWRKVQPEIAKTTRVCAWDRPGFGFSRGTRQPQDVMNTTADLEAALKVSRISGPYIAVGHSLGGYEALLFKDRNSRAVTGMVLVDPSIPDQLNRFRKAAPQFFAFLDKLETSQLGYFDRCIAGLKSGKLKVGGKDPESCLAYPSDYPQKLSMMLAALDTDPLRFTAARSMFEHLKGDGSSVVNAKRNYGDMPMIVLTATKMQEMPPGMPQAAKDQIPDEQAEWGRAHDELAALSSRGVNRRVPDATHYIQYDKPQAVIAAVEEVVRAARTNTGSMTVGTRR